MDGNAFKPLFDLFKVLIPFAIIGVLAIVVGGAWLLYLALL